MNVLRILTEKGDNFQEQIGQISRKKQKEMLEIKNPLCARNQECLLVDCTRPGKESVSSRTP